MTDPNAVHDSLQGQLGNGEAVQPVYSNLLWNNYQYPIDYTQLSNWGAAYYPQGYSYFPQMPENPWGGLGCASSPTSYLPQAYGTTSTDTNLTTWTSPPEAPNSATPTIQTPKPSMASMLSPLNVTERQPRPRLSKQGKQILKEYIRPEDHHKKYAEAMKDVRERLKKDGKDTFPDHQIRNLLIVARREASNEKQKAAQEAILSSK